MLDVSAREEITLRLGRGGPAVAVARKADTVRMEGDSFGGLVLARLKDGVEGRNELPGGERLTAFGPLPKVGAPLRVATVRGLTSVKVAAIEPALIKVNAAT